MCLEPPRDGHLDRHWPRRVLHGIPETDRSLNKHMLIVYQLVILHSLAIHDVTSLQMQRFAASNPILY